MRGFLIIYWTVVNLTQTVTLIIQKDFLNFMTHVIINPLMINTFFSFIVLRDVM